MLKDCLGYIISPLDLVAYCQHSRTSSTMRIGLVKSMTEKTLKIAFIDYDSQFIEESGGISPHKVVILEREFEWDNELPIGKMRDKYCEVYDRLTKEIKG